MSEVLERGPDGWRPACPLPFYVRTWRTLFRWRYRCECGAMWRTETVHKMHWRREHGAPVSDTEADNG